MTNATLKTATQVRKEYIDFFVARGHRYVPSSPVVPSDDPTLLFTNAGMNQFKDVFLGTGKRDYKRAANSQKCIRVSGKHNDLEEVGLDTYHHTFFEMLGNWSFGDYFKKDAITWSWQLLTEVWKLPKERLWVTVFGGDAKDGLPADEEAERLWKECTDIDPTHVLRFGRKDNFWEMGETGPCGPCTEIHIDRGGPGSDPHDGANPKIGVNAGNERFMELWNNVFMQFNRLDNGSLAELPAKSVDTGMGFERVLAVIQGKSSNYDTDLFQPLFRRMEQLTGLTYGKDNEVDIAFRVCADHIRTISAAIADGALPSNEGRGYVLRRLLRRAARFGRQRLGMRQPFLFDVVPTVAEILGPAFPEIPARAEHIRGLVKAEEESFAVTLDRGLVLFDQLVKSSSQVGGSYALSGAGCYDLSATYGFPQDLVEQMARERGLEIDQAELEKAREAHRNASRGEGTFKQLLSADQIAELAKASQPIAVRASGVSGFLSTATAMAIHSVPTCCEDEVRLAEVEPERSFSLTTRVFDVYTEPGKPDRLVLEQTPFYPESGGQVGDAGVVENDSGFRFVVEDTQRIGGIPVHIGKLVSGVKSFGLSVVAKVDRERRARTAKNHTATHLMHKALKEVLGLHVAQQGSYVGPDRLRFDFSHGKAVSAEELEQIEQRVSEHVWGNAKVVTTIEALEAAKARGVVAMFGEKYEERVRVLDVGGWSMELCGGTHVHAAGDIGPFVIQSERAVAAGVRRIEALTGPEALAYLQAQRRTLASAARTLKAPAEELPARIEQLQAQLKEARKTVAAASKADVGSAFDALKAKLVVRGGVTCVVADLADLDGEGVRELGDRAKTLSKDLALVLLGRQEGRVPFLIAFEGAALQKGLKAGELAKEFSAHLGGGGGGRPNVAQGQGLKPEGVPGALAATEAYLAKL